jgi:mannose-6-phosphate isomerase-like protein (cupin superfamily)
MNEPAGQGVRDAAWSGLVIGPGEGRTIPGTDAITLIATTEQTGGSIGASEDVSSPGDGPPRHVHHGSDELYYLLEGEFRILVGERQERVSAGTYVFVPTAACISVDPERYS